jgi:hypothetical protein
MSIDVKENQASLGQRNDLFWSSFRGQPMWLTEVYGKIKILQTFSLRDKFWNKQIFPTSSMSENDICSDFPTSRKLGKSDYSQAGQPIICI